ncbi:MAG: hypothetical protein KGI41_00500 [Patescibacteria group bacterium]|nr:hypothetical protein [Patescibacteria group bacterium]MDE1965709.1 hypothetical protein [Patescibacteria group bacterium]
MKVGTIEYTGGDAAGVRKLTARLFGGANLPAVSFSDISRALGNSEPAFPGSSSKRIRCESSPAGDAKLHINVEGASDADMLDLATKLAAVIAEKLGYSMTVTKQTLQ